MKTSPLFKPTGSIIPYYEDMETNGHWLPNFFQVEPITASKIIGIQQLNGNWGNKIFQNQILLLIRKESKDSSISQHHKKVYPE